MLNPFIRILQQRTAEAPEKRILHFGAGSGAAAWTWGELWDRSLAAASGLRDAGVRAGDHLLLVVTDPQDSVACLFGAWAAGAVPIQIGLPFRLGDLWHLVPHLEETARRLDACTMVASATLASTVGEAGSIAVLPVKAVTGTAATLDQPVEAPGPALIQLTSGSLGRQRGVVVPAARLHGHLESITRALPPGPGAVGVSWLPLHHDMGLIGGLLYPLFNGFPLHLFSPRAFRARPYAWLEALSEVGATHTAGPPSAYALANRMAPRAVSDGLDLGALRCAMVGAELIPPAVLRDFSGGLAACGFRPEAFFPVYGLAEATVAASFPRPLSKTAFDRVDAAELHRKGRAVPSDSAEGLEFTGVGAAIPGVEIRIVDRAGHTLPERLLGEIQIQSDSVMTGYYGDREATRRAFSGGWLRTGDLGYFADGSLYVTGRNKEMIIRGGQNLSPQVIEEAVRRIEGLRPGAVAAVGIRSRARGTERAILVAETAARAELHQDLIQRIAASLRARALEVDEIKLVPPHWLPRTTSGKLRRCALPAMLAAAA